MNLDLEILFSSLAFGIAIFFLLYSGEEWIERGMNFLEKDLAKQLRRMRFPTTSLRRYLSSWIIIVSLIFIVGLTGFQMPVLSAGICCLLVGLPWYYVRRAAFQRSMKIEDQLADAMVSLSSSIRAGLSLPQALEILSKQCPEPICFEFQQIFGEYRMGKTMEVCLEETKDRLQSENFALFSAAMEASRRSGGKLNETVERIAHSVRELQRLERKIQSETASARASAFYMGLVPFFILGIYYFALDPVSTERLFTTFVGQIMLVIAVVLDVLAYFWARHILNQEFENSNMNTFTPTTLAWITTLNSTAIIGSVAFGASIVLISWTIIRLLSTEDMQQDDEWSYDVNRINELRKASAMYRFFQPLIQAFAIINRRAFASELPEIGREIQAAGFSRFWTPTEYLGKIELTAVFISPLYLYFCMEFMGPPGIVLAVLMVILTAYMLRRSLTNTALYRITTIKRRLPFMLDLMTLLMEAGSTFLDALRESVTEFRGHPAGVEFGRILGEMRMGKTRTAALESMRERLQDDEITSIVGSIIQGENQGTPLALLFRTQADVLRVKRTQRAETIAGEAGVKMLLPGLLVMMSTLLIILGPFVLRFFYDDFLS